VYENDINVFDASYQQILTFCISKFIPNNIYDNYLNFCKSKSWIPCEKNIKFLPEQNIIVKNYLTRLSIERYERKLSFFLAEIASLKNDWEEYFYRLLGKSFGFSVNSLSFYRLTCITPLKLLIKEGSSVFALEALLYGQAGLINSSLHDEYPRKLLLHYQHLANKHKLTSMNKHEWKFLRIRPTGFPTIRISQFANLLQTAYPIFRAIIESKTDDIIKLFEQTSSEYWNNHFCFDKKASNYFIKKLSIAAITSILINSVVPALFTYGHYMKDLKIKQKALDILYALPAEDNKIIRKWGANGIKALNAADSQGLIELKTMYCNVKNCLKCTLGYYLLK
ncbi:MAG TPA: DUF2851 family protein, partial [Bacteroidales bacterium]|nr:DUF2851 family protein [Bacteroidales bacterium]